MKKKQWPWLLLPVMVILLGVVGITYGWLTQNVALSTLMKIVPPDTITIVPVNGETGAEVALLDLDFVEGVDQKDDTGAVHIFRPLYIKSTSPIHRLEVAHTTNLNELGFHIYPATKNADGSIARGDPALTGAYANREGTTAKQQLLENYQSGDTVEKHAYPLYWIANECYASGTEITPQENWQAVTSYNETALNPKDGKDTNFYVTYYVLEIIWKEESKETDLFYIIAQNIDAVSGWDA